MIRFLLAAALGVSACTTARLPAPPPDPVGPNGVTLTADQADYMRGASANLTLTNGASRVGMTGDIGCVGFEVWNRNAWEPSPSNTHRVCLSAGVILQPGTALTGPVRLDVPAGTYRLMQSVGFEETGESVTAATAPFRVR